MASVLEFFFEMYNGDRDLWYAGVAEKRRRTPSLHMLLGDSLLAIPSVPRRVLLGSARLRTGFLHLA
jgi:hypothetical protein